MPSQHGRALPDQGNLPTELVRKAPPDPGNSPEPNPARLAHPQARLPSGYRQATKMLLPLGLAAE
jgi:hypothetical protein